MTNIEKNIQIQESVNSLKNSSSSYISTESSTESSYLSTESPKEFTNKFVKLKNNKLLLNIKK